MNLETLRKYRVSIVGVRKGRLYLVGWIFKHRTTIHILYLVKSTITFLPHSHQYRPIGYDGIEKNIINVKSVLVSH